MLLFLQIFCHFQDEYVNNAKELLQTNKLNVEAPEFKRAKNATKLASDVSNVWKRKLFDSIVKKPTLKLKKFPTHHSNRIKFENFK